MGDVSALKELRDTLKHPVPDVETLVFTLSSVLHGLSIHPTSVPPSRGDPSIHRSITRYLPSVQTSLLSSVVPNFIHALDDSQSQLLVTFFVPSKSNNRNTLAINRFIALTTYLTLPNLLSSAKQVVSLPTESRHFVLNILDSLSKAYNIDDLYWAVWGSSFGEGTSRDGYMKMMQWEEAVRSVVGIPGKTANAVGRWKADGWGGDISSGLIPRTYFDRLAVRFEGVLYEVSQSTPKADLAPLRLVIEKLAAQGLLKISPSTQPSPQPSLLTPLFPDLLAHLHPTPTSPLSPYPSTFLPSMLLPLPSSTLSSFTYSLLQHVTFLLPTVPPSNPLLPELPDARIRVAVDVLEGVLGKAAVGGEAWESVIRNVVEGKLVQDVMGDRGHAMARVIVGWMGRGGEQAIKSFIDTVMDTWTEAKYIRFSLYTKQFYLTHTLILALSLLPPYHPFIVALSHRPRFILALQSYLSHPDAKIRRLGMLVAELVSQISIPETQDDTLDLDPETELEDLKAGLEVDDDTGESKVKEKKRAGKMKRLRFGAEMWSGEGEGKDESRWLRASLGARDEDAIIPEDNSTAYLLGWDQAKPNTAPDSQSLVIDKPRGRQPKQRSAPTPKSQPKPKIIMLDPDQEADPLTGYDLPSPSSSRSPSPTPSYLEEVAADPTLALDSSQKKKVTRPVYVLQLVELLKEREKPDHIEMGLKWGEGLIRAKRSFGRELAESSVALASMVIALNDSFNLDNFEERRQNILTALVACAPKTVAPYLAEQYFGGYYSLQQRSILLTALAMGARELAGLPVPPGQVNSRRIDFPTKTLPAHLHKKYITPQDHHPDQIEDAVAGVRNMLISKGAKKGEETVPELAREKRLRLGTSKRTLIAEVGSLNDEQLVQQDKPQSQTPVIPFKDIASECFIMPLINRFWQYFQDTTTREDRSIRTGKRYTGAGTGMILSPMALEKFLMTLSLLVHAARHSATFLSILSPEALELGLLVGRRRSSQPQEDEVQSEGQPHSEAQIVGAALELCLVSLDGAVDLDKGKTLVTDKPALVLSVGEWAMKVFEKESTGEVAAGSGGEREGRIRAAAAGVVVKVSEITEKFSGMGTMLR